MTEPPCPTIADHGLIGDLQTAALVATDATIAWLCLPRFDSPSVFAALLDVEQGGNWRMAPTCGVSATHQFYFPDSNVLITRFLTEDGVVEVHDFMPVGPENDEPRRGLVRRVVAVRGEMELRTEVRPRFDYARHAAAVRRPTDGDAIGRASPRSQRGSAARSYPGRSSSAPPIDTSSPSGRTTSSPHT